MPTYVADRHQPGLTLEQVMAAQQAALEANRRFATEGRPVRYLHSVFVPSEARCLSLFDALNAKLVQELNEVAQIPFTRIVEALMICP
jgi:hypothetical protein